MELSEVVKAMETEHERYRQLCAQILTTIALDGNKNRLNGPVWEQVVAQWMIGFRSINPLYAEEAEKHAKALEQQA
jgi:hypothetical protein